MAMESKFTATLPFNCERVRYFTTPWLSITKKEVSFVEFLTPSTLRGSNAGLLIERTI